MLNWIRNGLLVFVAIAVVTLIGALPLLTLYFAYKDFGFVGASLWYVIAVALALMFELRVLRNRADDGRIRLAIWCLIWPLLVLAAALVVCLPLYLILRLF